MMAPADAVGLIIVDILAFSDAHGCLYAYLRQRFMFYGFSEMRGFVFRRRFDVYLVMPFRIFIIFITL